MPQSRPKRVCLRTIAMAELPSSGAAKRMSIAS
jgi:hypothetical protein